MELPQDYWRRQAKADEGSGRLKSLERPARLVALFLLCGLVWWFSYDHGRESSKSRVARTEAENISLREKVALLEEDVKALSANLERAKRAASAGQKEAGGEAGGEVGSRPALSEADGSGAVSNQEGRMDYNRADSGQADSGIADAARADSGQAGPGAASGSPKPVASGSPAELPPVPAVSGSSGRAGADRVTVKLSENKGVFGGRVVITLVELDQEALVRAHYRETGRRLAQLMAPGDILELDLDGEEHRLYLDQIRGTLAFFIVDGLPGGEER